MTSVLLATGEAVVLMTALYVWGESRVIRGDLGIRSGWRESPGSPPDGVHRAFWLDEAGHVNLMALFLRPN